MRRGIAASPEPNGRTASRRSVGEMKQEQADLARDAKKEEAMCSFGLCQKSHNLQQGPDGWTGPYGGSHLCEEHYKDVIDYIRDNGCLKSENYNRPDSMDDFFES